MKKAHSYSFQNAFTMLELVFVIVVAGILATIIIPNTRTNPVQEAAIQLVSHIRYAQHLAIVDDRFNQDNLDTAGNIKWYKERWSIRFNSDAHSDNQEAYTIFSDNAGDSTGNADLSEVARDPQNSDRVLSGGITGPNSLDINHDTFQGNRKMNLGLSYGITNVAFNGGCNQQSFAFDHLGRPINSRLNGYVQSYENNDLIQVRCEIVLSSSMESVTIAIEPETGYAHIL